MVTISTAGPDTKSEEWDDMADHFIRLATYLRMRGVAQKKREGGDSAQAVSQEAECRQTIERLALDFPGAVRLM